MSQRKYTVAGPNPAYGAAPGEIVTLDDSDPTVQLNVAAGVLAAPDGEAAPDEKMTCPLCVERELKQPPRFTTPDDLEGHYAERHPGFATPEWRAD